MDKCRVCEREKKHKPLEVVIEEIRHSTDYHGAHSLSTHELLSMVANDMRQMFKDLECPERKRGYIGRWMIMKKRLNIE